jgi:hypothetical protein
VWDTIKHARRYSDLARFLLCIVLYQSGVQAVIALAAIYAQQAMGFTMRDTLLLVLVVNVTASLGALGFGFVQDRLGHVPTGSVRRQRGARPCRRNAGEMRLASLDRASCFAGLPKIRESETIT